MTKDPMREDQGFEATAADTTMSRFRERVAAFIAVLVMIVFAFHYIGDNEKFARAKDLLLIINPVLGGVIGYYFNKVSTEARAENTARNATANARQAAASRDKAESLAGVSRANAQQTRAHLDEVSQAAEKMLAQTPGRTAGTLGASETGKAAEDARSELEAALARAKPGRIEEDQGG